MKKPGVFWVGFIQFAIAGGSTLDSSYKLTGGTFDAAQDENSVVFADQSSYMIALQIKKYVESYRENEVHVAGESIFMSDNILKLKGLMDQGLISAEEFELKKRQLFGLFG